MIVKWSGVHCEVYNEKNQLVDELFQSLLKQEQDQIFHEIGHYKDWAAECQQAGVLAVGTYFLLHREGEDH